MCNSFSAMFSIGNPWQSQPQRRSQRYPFIVQYPRKQVLADESEDVAVVREPRCEGRSIVEDEWIAFRPLGDRLLEDPVPFPEFQDARFTLGMRHGHHHSIFLLFCHPYFRWRLRLEIIFLGFKPWWFFACSKGGSSSILMLHYVT